jgi:hypothetical protein
MRKFILFLALLLASVGAANAQIVVCPPGAYCPPPHPPTYRYVEPPHYYVPHYEGYRYGYGHDNRYHDRYQYNYWNNHH